MKPIRALPVDNLQAQKKRGERRGGEHRGARRSRRQQRKYAPAR